MFKEVLRTVFLILETEHMFFQVTCCSTSDPKKACSFSRRLKRWKLILAVCRQFDGSCGPFGFSFFLINDGLPGSWLQKPNKSSPNRWAVESTPTMLLSSWKLVRLFGEVHLELSTMLKIVRTASSQEWMNVGFQRFILPKALNSIGDSTSCGVRRQSRDCDLLCVSRWEGPSDISLLFWVRCTKNMTLDSNA